MFDLALIYGMTAEQYWNSDPEIFYNYKNSYETKRKIKEQDIWLQAKYFQYSISCSVQNVSGITDYKNFKIPDFPERPYNNENEKSIELTEQQLENERLKTYAFFKSFAKRKF